MCVALVLGMSDRRPHTLASLILAVAVAGCAADAASGSSDVAETADEIVGGAESTQAAGIGYLAVVWKDSAGEVKNKPFCTATLIARDVVLTAGHCLVGPRPDPPEGASFVGIGFGTGEVSNAVTLLASQTAHPGYAFDAKLERNDLGYGVLEKPIASVPLGVVRRSRHRGHCDYVATGYGRTKEGGGPREPGEKVLRKAIALCADAPLTSDEMIDAYSGRGSPCFGDSGGPLRLRGSTELVGVASYISSLCKLDTHVYYVPLAKHLAFIDEALASSRAR
jgi:secreted trypsin-like serine protease